MSTVRQLYLVGSSLGIIIVLIRVIVAQSFDAISTCFLQSLDGLGFLFMVTLFHSCSASTPRMTTRREGKIMALFINQSEILLSKYYWFSRQPFSCCLVSREYSSFPSLINNGVFCKKVPFQSIIASPHITFFVLFTKPTPP